MRDDEGMPSLSQRVVDAAQHVLGQSRSVSPVDANVRHEDTDYDKLLMSGVARDEARARVRDAVDAVLDRWRSVG